jgi:hypothetical protein
MKTLDTKDLNYFGTDKAPFHPSTFSIIPTKNGDIILTFAWIPPEKMTDFHILSRMSLPKDMAKTLAEELQKSVGYIEQSEAASREKISQTHKRKS